MTYNSAPSDFVQYNPQLKITRGGMMWKNMVAQRSELCR